MFFPALFGGATTNNVPSGQVQPKWFSNIIGRSAKSGANVNPETAMGLSTVRACVTLLAESVAQIPCNIYRRDGDSRKLAYDHPLFPILSVAPNEKDSAFEYFEFAQGHLGIGGDHFALVRRDERSRVIELMPVHPSKVQVLKGHDGLPYYKLMEHNEVLHKRHVHHIKCFSENGYTGLSPIEANTDVLGLAMAVEDHAAGVFARGANMSGVIEGPEGKTIFSSQEKLDTFLGKFIDKHSGGNSLSIALLQEGLTYKQISMDNEKAQLLESRGKSVEEICRLYRIPRHMVQDDSKTNFNTVEQLSINYVTFTMLPWLKRHESAMRRDLLLPSEQGEFYIEFDVSQLMKGDLKSRYESYAIGRQWGWLSVNDIRRLENLSPIEGGSRYLTPLNMMDSNQIQQAYSSGVVDVSQAKIQEIEAICRN